MEIHAVAILHPKRWPKKTRRLFKRDDPEFNNLWHKILWQASALGGGVLDMKYALDEPELKESLVICFRDSEKRDELAHYCAKEMGETGIVMTMVSAGIEIPGEDPEAFRDCLDPNKPAARL